MGIFVNPKETAAVDWFETVDANGETCWVNQSITADTELSGVSRAIMNQHVSYLNPSIVLTNSEQHEIMMGDAACGSG